MPPDRLLLILRKITAATLFVLMAISASVWLPIRQFPIAPVLNSLPALPDTVCYLVYASLMLLLGLITFSKQTAKYILVFCLLFWAYSLFDYTRIQVYYLQFSLMLAGVGLAEYIKEKKLDDNPEEVLNGFRLFFVFCYIWSGVYKLNGAFYHSVMPWFLEPITHLLGISDVPDWVGETVAIIELLGGVFLLIPQSRKLGVAIVVSIHLFIFGCIGPLGHNWNVITWPWNVAMSVIVLLLFWNFTAYAWGKWHLNISTAFKLFVVVFAGLMPSLYSQGKWDSSFSFNLYSGTSKSGVIFLTEPEIAQLPANLQQYILKQPGSTGQRYIDLTYWGYGDLKVLPYPEERAFRKMHRNFSRTFYNKENVGILYMYSHYDVWLESQKK